MVNVLAIPGHPLAVGKTVIVAVLGKVSIFIPMKEAILPEPLAARPIDGFELVQLNDVPATEPANSMDVVEVRLQIV